MSLDIYFFLVGSCCSSSSNYNIHYPSLSPTSAFACALPQGYVVVTATSALQSMSKLDYCFSNDYMVLRPDRAGPVEFLHLLFSPKVGRNRAVDCFTSTEIRSFARRLVQVLLLSLSGPLAALGAAVEFVLNLVDNVLHGQCACM